MLGEMSVIERSEEDDNTWKEEDRDCGGGGLGIRFPYHVYSIFIIIIQIKGKMIILAHLTE